jgi:hypothetical protein
VKIWLIFEEVDGALVYGVMETVYQRGDSGSADLEQALDGYRRQGRTDHVLELDVWLKNEPAVAEGPTFAAEWALPDVTSRYRWWGTYHLAAGGLPMPLQFICGVDGLDGQSAPRSPWRADPAVPVSNQTQTVPWSPPSRAGGGGCHPRSLASGIAYLACPAARRVLDCRSRRMWGPTPQQCIERESYRRRLRSTSSVAGSDVGGPIVRADTDVSHDYRWRKTGDDVACA